MLSRILLLVTLAVGGYVGPLFGPDAGFHPRESVTITVWQPDAWSHPLRRAIAGWNRMAGRELLERTWTRTDADVVLRDPDGPGDGYPPGWYAVPISEDGQFSLDGPYVHCEIWLSTHPDTRYGAQVAAHELGHCLGFHHRQRGIVDGEWFKPVDRLILERAGYRT